jgi:putative toxin-antitoxin system antitoxin component (TIGR02293 family)
MWHNVSMAIRAKIKGAQALSPQRAAWALEREVVRCESCKLVQFKESNGVCRRCKRGLIPETKGSLSLVARAFSFDLMTLESGLPLEALSRFVEISGLSLTEIYDVVIAARTLKHRRLREESLSRDESDKLARLMRVYDQAVQVFGDTERALWWLRESGIPFGGRTPLQMTRTEFGGRLAEEALVQIDEGIFA